MEYKDMRRLSFEAREERRQQVVGLRRRGWTYDAIAEETGLSRTGMFDICQRHAREGAKGLKDKQGERKVGEHRALSAEQEAEIRKLITDKTPDQLKLGFALWNRQADGMLIQGCQYIRLTLQGVGEYLARWGFTPQKPLKRAYEQRPETIQAWLNDAYPEIAQRAKAEGAEIHWGDETGLRSNDVRSRSYAPAGKTPEIQVTNRREGLSVMSTVTNRARCAGKCLREP
jgi:transposase